MDMGAMRLFIVASIASSLFAATIPVVVVGTTATQAILRYKATSDGACTVEVSPSSGYIPIVHDVNANLFSGENSDARSSSANIGRLRQFVVGANTVARSSVDGRRYSRALQADTLYYVRVTCGTDVGQTTFHTANPPTGNTRTSNGVSADPNISGAYLQPTPGWTTSRSSTVNTSGTTVTWVSGDYFNPNWRIGASIVINSVAYSLAGVVSPTSLVLATSAGTQSSVPLSAADRDEQLIDPQTGILIRRLSMPGDHPNTEYMNQSFTAASGSAWTNPSNALVQDSTYASYAGTAKDILTLTIAPNIYIADGLDGFVLKLTGYGTATSADDRAIEACIDLNADGTCDSDWVKGTLPTSNGTVSVYQGSIIDTWRGSYNPWWKPIQTAEIYQSSTFRILVRKYTTSSDPIYIDASKLDVKDSTWGTSTAGGSAVVCQDVTTTNGFTLCVAGSSGSHANIYAFNTTTGETRFIGQASGTFNSRWTRWGVSAASGFGWDPTTVGVFWGSPVTYHNEFWKCTLNAPETEVAVGAQANMSCTKLIDDIRVPLAAFDSNFDSTKYDDGCFIAGIHNTYAGGICWRGTTSTGVQDTYGWIFVFDLTQNPPTVIAATTIHGNPRSRWATLHSYDPPGNQNGIGYNLQTMNAGKIGGGPYRATLNTAMNATDSSSTVNITSTWNSGWGTAPSGFHPGEPLSQYDDHFLQTIAVGDMFFIGSEWMKVTARSYPDANNLQVTVTRGYLGTTKTTHNVGDTVQMRYDAGTTESAAIVWKFLQDPHGTDTTNTYLVADTNAAAHLTRRGNRKVESGMSVEWYATSSIMDAPNVQETRYYNVSPSFNGVIVSGEPNYWMSHVTYHQVNAPASEKEWALDGVPLLTLSSPGSMTLQSGTTGVYKVGRTVYPKLFDTMAFCGGTPAKDISSAATGNQITDSTPYSYCYANAAGECRTGSSVGDFYISCPGLSSPSTCGSGANTICVSSVPFDGFQIMQYGFGKNMYARNPSRLTDNGMLYSRALGSLLETKNTDTNLAGDRSYWSAKATADGKWAFTEMDAGVRSDAYMIKIPPQPPLDTLNRSTFVPLPVRLAGGWSTAEIAFGYDSSFRCTSRNEACVSVASSAAWDTYSPFKWEGEAKTRVSCTSGCTVYVPLLAGKVTYYKWRYYDNGGNLKASGPTQVVAVP